jgi:hypothetical protein
MPEKIDILPQMFKFMISIDQKLYIMAGYKILPDMALSNATKCNIFNDYYEIMSDSNFSMWISR